MAGSKHKRTGRNARRACNLILRLRRGGRSPIQSSGRVLIISTGPGLPCTHSPAQWPPIPHAKSQANLTACVCVASKRRRLFSWVSNTDDLPLLPTLRQICLFHHAFRRNLLHALILKGNKFLAPYGHTNTHSNADMFPVFLATEAKINSTGVRAFECKIVYTWSTLDCT